MNANLEGKVADVVPLLKQMWAWTTDHYVPVMLFVLALAAIITWRRRS